MTTLSICMIVKNEEALLGRSLQSVQGLADQIIVVDTGSTDKTIEIAVKYGAHVERFEWCDDFAAARNYSLSFATGDWILILDADESLDPAEHAQIRSLIESNESNAYALTLRNYFMSGNTTTFDKPAMKNDSGFNMEFPYMSDSVALRLWKRGPLFKNRIHELPEIKDFKVVETHIHHYGKMNTPREGAKRDYYLRLAKEEAKARPMDCQLHFSLAGEAYVMNEWQTALDAAKAYMRLEPDAVPLMMILVAGCSSAAMEKHEHALYYFQKVLETEPTHSLAMVQAAKSLFQIGQPDKAFNLIRQAINISPDFTGGYMTLMRMQEILGDYANALLTVLKGLETNPHDPGLISHFDRLITLT